MKNKFSMTKRQMSRTAIAIGFLAIIGAQHFNCAPTTMKAMQYELSSSSSIRGGPLSANKTSPITILTSHQVYSSMLSVSGQSDTPSQAVRSEYADRRGALAPDAAITNVNAPLQTATTSLAGEVCSGLIAKESAANATRKFFVGVNFQGTPAADSAQNFTNAVNVMAKSFFGREITSEEQAIMSAFRTDFLVGISNNAAGTRSLYLAACSGMLSSFDSMTY